MFWMRKKNGRLEFMPRSPDKGISWYTARGYMLYSGTLQRSRVDIEGGTMDDNGIVRGGTIAALPAPRISSTLKLRDHFTASGNNPDEFPNRCSAEA